MRKYKNLAEMLFYWAEKNPESDIYKYKKNGRWLVKTTVTIEIEGVEKPAAVIETLTLYVVKE